MAITDEIPKSRITLTYRIPQGVEQKEVNIPFRLLILGDLSGGTSKDRKLELDKRDIRRLDGKNLNKVMADMNMTIDATVQNCIDPANAEKLPVKLPVTSMSSFTPAEVARNVPKIRALLLLKKLLLEVQANIDNSKDFRKLLRALAANDKAAGDLKQQLQGFEGFQLPPGRSEKKDKGPEA
ncbi:MAG TPA: type VI secretion system contractile sheath small subunit [Sorangium sp.]|nr:type VI secretion system contractile sheath small subunit [Sorangium sp.]